MTTRREGDSLSGDGGQKKNDHDEREEVINITVEFTGGLEMLFSNIQSHQISLPSSSPSAASASASASVSASTPTSTATHPTTISDLISHLVTTTMRDSRKELFVLEDGGEARYSIRPGILVLINDADWELEGEEGYVLRDGDGVLFVSTLHGG